MFFLLIRVLNPIGSGGKNKLLFLLFQKKKTNPPERAFSIRAGIQEQTIAHTQAT
jgi:hypothetical protein